MALIKCKGCGKEISSFAESCPNCGRKASTYVKYPQFYEKTEETYKKEESYSPQNTYFPGNIQNNFAQNNAANYNHQTFSKVNVSCVTCCPRCGSVNIFYQREQSASFGAGTNKVVIQKAKKSKGCLWWMFIGFWWIPMYWIFIGWWWKPLIGGRTKSGLNFNASKSINRTMAVCQNCGNSWKAK